MNLHQELRRLDNRILAAKVVGYLLPISEVLNTDARMVLCPFHVDSRPSAKIFSDDEDGIERLYCFSCRRAFTSYELLKDRGKDPLSILFDTCPDAAIKAAIDAVKEGVVIQDFSEHYHLLEKKDQISEESDVFLNKLDRFLRIIYLVEEK